MRAHSSRALRLAAGGAAAALVVTAAPATAAPTPKPSPAVTSTVTASAAFRPADPRLASPAGLVAGVVHPDIWWTIGSASGRPQLFALDTRGRTRAAYTLAGVSGGLDAITIVKNGSGQSGLFVGNLDQGRAGSLTLYRVPEPSALAGGALQVKPFKVRYPDGGHQGGALLADPAESRVYIITRDATAAAVFALPGVLGPQVNALTRLRTLAFPVRGGEFTRDGRVVLKTTRDVRVLTGIRERVGQVVRAAVRMSGTAFAVSADGKRVLLADPGPKPLFRSLTLPTGSEGAAPKPASTLPVGDRSSPVSFPSESGPPGGLLGTGALVGLVLLGVLGGAFYLRGRRQG
ncbi:MULTISPECIES: hypothetical protein [Actinomadura]|uniref:Esterase-like activity of phytase family protein n=1 Tax=Actinomadura litoris TaxID=2678616 RepID=A0A7K1L708_9ACTN|nr:MULTISPECIES: hypothetical protein [Actinomadura]MBT2213864.1 hypothetical protein [Actinomadura sp. NEAU-AAG7]MUN39975.1 hypothetical protein [Actinomadura litoris]